MDIVQAIKDEDMDTLVRNKDRLSIEIVPDVYPIHLALCQNNWPIIQLILTETCKQKGKEFSLLSKNSKIQKLQLERMSPAIRDLAWMVWSEKTDEWRVRVEQPSVGWFEETVKERFARYKQEVTSAIPKMNGGTIYSSAISPQPLSENNEHIKKLFEKSDDRIKHFIRDRKALWDRYNETTPNTVLTRTTSSVQMAQPETMPIRPPLSHANTTGNMTVQNLLKQLT